MTDLVQIDRVHPEEHPAVMRLLQQHHLPIDGLEHHWPHTLVARRQARVIGSAALELYADGALLRSVVVNEEERGRGIAHDLVEAALAEAAAAGTRDIYLLTTTAGGYFPRFGFTVVSRADVPASVQASVEFTTACPNTATVMHARLS